jgi:hypothetical protein
MIARNCFHRKAPILHTSAAMPIPHLGLNWFRGIFTFYSQRQRPGDPDLEEAAKCYPEKRVEQTFEYSE